jgi:hypothetical protein
MQILSRIGGQTLIGWLSGVRTQNGVVATKGRDGKDSCCKWFYIPFARRGGGGSIFIGWTSGVWIQHACSHRLEVIATWCVVTLANSGMCLFTPRRLTAVIFLVRAADGSTRWLGVLASSVVHSSGTWRVFNCWFARCASLVWDIRICYSAQSNIFTAVESTFFLSETLLPIPL